MKNFLLISVIVLSLPACTSLYPTQIFSNQMTEKQQEKTLGRPALSLPSSASMLEFPGAAHCTVEDEPGHVISIWATKSDCHEWIVEAQKRNYIPDKRSSLQRDIEAHKEQDARQQLFQLAQDHYDEINAWTDVPPTPDSFRSAPPIPLPKDVIACVLNTQKAGLLHGFMTRQDCDKWEMAHEALLKKTMPPIIANNPGIVDAWRTGPLMIKLQQDCSNKLNRYGDASGVLVRQASDGSGDYICIGDIR